MSLQINILDILRVLWLGSLETLRIVPLCIIISLIFGIIIGVIRSLRIPIVGQILTVYIVIMRGIPPLVLLFIIFFTLSLGSPLTSAIFCLSLYHTAYVGEIVKGGIQSIPKGQGEAAKALGLNTYQTMRFIMLPQIFYSILPALCGQYIILVKDTAIVSVIGVQEIVWSGRQVMQLVYRPFEIFFLIGMFFFVICYFLARVSAWLESKVKEETIVLRSK